MYVSHSGLSPAALRVEIETNFVMHLSMRSSAQEEDNIIEHAQCCPGKDIEKYSPLFRLMVKLFFTL